MVHLYLDEKMKWIDRMIEWTALMGTFDKGKSPRIVPQKLML